MVALSYDGLREALRGCLTYPDNIPQGKENPKLIKHFKRHFERIKKRLLVEEEALDSFYYNIPGFQGKINLHIYDRAIDSGISKKVRQLRELQEHLGIYNFTADDSGSKHHNTQEDYQPEPDPVCRCIIIQTALSGTGRILKLTEAMLLQILTYHNVFPCFLDFISNFGHENLTRDSDMLFGGFRGLKSFPEDNEDAGPSKGDINRKAFSQDMKELGRSGLNFQLAFELKTISRSADFNDTDSGLGREEDLDGSVFDEPRRNAGFIAWIWDRNHPSSKPRGRQGEEDQAETNKAELSLMSWDFTQTAVYHQFDLDSGKSFWIIATAEIDTDDEFEDFKQRILNANKLSSASITEQFKFSLDMVLLLVEWSLSEYGFYITTLDDDLNAQTRKYTSEGTAPINAKSLMWINRYMESLDHCISGLQANLRVCQAIMSFYMKDLLKDPKLRKSGARWTADDPLIRKYIKEFAVRLQVSHMALNGMLRRALAVKQTGTRREETIQRLLQNANEQRMKELAHITSRDSTIMKVFTTVTIFLLPASVVSSFFSTQIVDFENFPGFTGIWSGPAAVWWAGITLITTVVAVMFAEVAYQVEVKRLSDSGPMSMNHRSILEMIGAGFSVIWEGLRGLWSWLKKILWRKRPNEHSYC